MIELFRIWLGWELYFVPVGPGALGFWQPEWEAFCFEALRLMYH